MSNSASPKNTSDVNTPKDASPSITSSTNVTPTVPDDNIVTTTDISDERQESLKNKISELSDVFMTTFKKVFLKSITTIGSLMKVDLTNKQDVQNKLAQIQQNLTDPETREATLNLLKTIKPLIDPLISILAKEYELFFSKMGESSVSAGLNALKVVPGFGEVIAGINLISNLLDLGFATANSSVKIATTFVDTGNAFATNVKNATTPTIPTTPATTPTTTPATIPTIPTIPTTSAATPAATSDTVQKGGLNIQHGRSIKKMHYLKKCKMKTMYRTQCSINNFNNPKCKKTNSKMCHKMCRKTHRKIRRN
jgi:hypothetical protein